MKIQITQTLLGSLLVFAMPYTLPNAFASNMDTIEVEAQQNLLHLVKRYNEINPKTGESYAAGLVENVRNASLNGDVQMLRERIVQLWLYGLDLRAPMHLPDGTVGTIGSVLAKINIRIDDYLQNRDLEHAKDLQSFFNDLDYLRYTVTKDKVTQKFSVEPNNVELYDVIGDFQDWFRNYIKILIERQSAYDPYGMNDEL